MNTKLNLTDDEVEWICKLKRNSVRKNIIHFILELNDIYKGIDSYLNEAEMPLTFMSECLCFYNSLESGERDDYFSSQFLFMPFF